MKHWRNSCAWITAILLAIAGVSSCEQHTAYHHFSSTPQAGWEKLDTLLFVVPPLAEPGRYSQQFDVRINESYPFTSLTLVVAQQIFPGNRRKQHILQCKFSEHNKYFQRRGISHYTYSFPLPDIDLRRGDSIQVHVRHDMKREILTGITDVGLKMVRRD